MGLSREELSAILLFAVYLDPLLDKLHKTKKGYFIGSICANAFAYADDVILLSALTPSAPWRYGNVIFLSVQQTVT